MTEIGIYHNLRFNCKYAVLFFSNEFQTKLKIHLDPEFWMNIFVSLRFLCPLLEVALSKARKIEKRYKNAKSFKAIGIFGMFMVIHYTQWIRCDSKLNRYPLACRNTYRLGKNIPHWFDCHWFSILFVQNEKKIVPNDHRTSIFNGFFILHSRHQLTSWQSSLANGYYKQKKDEIKHIIWALRYLQSLGKKRIFIYVSIMW